MSKTVLETLESIFKKIGWQYVWQRNGYFSERGNYFIINHFGTKEKGPCLFIYNEVADDIKYDESTGLLMIGDYACINLRAL